MGARTSLTLLSLQCIRGVDDNFEVMEEWLTVIPIHGQMTAQEIFRQLCDATVNAGLLEEHPMGCHQ